MGAYIRQRPARWFWTIAILATLWGLACCFLFFRHMVFGAPVMGPATPVDRRIFAELPMWYPFVYALAVLASVLGGIALLRRWEGARVLFAFSLAALVVQFSYVFLFTRILPLKGGETLILPVLLIGVAACETRFARFAQRRGWIN